MLKARILQVAKDKSKEGMKKAVQEKGPKRWTKQEIRMIEESLLTFGRLTKPEVQMAAWKKVRTELGTWPFHIGPKAPSPPCWGERNSLEWRPLEAQCILHVRT